MLTSLQFRLTVEDAGWYEMVTDKEPNTMLSITLRDSQNRTVSGTNPYYLTPGEYTVSFWAKEYWEYDVRYEIRQPGEQRTFSLSPWVDWQKVGGNLVGEGSDTYVFSLAETCLFQIKPGSGTVKLFSGETEVVIPVSGTGTDSVFLPPGEFRLVFVGTGAGAQTYLRSIRFSVQS